MQGGKLPFILIMKENVVWYIKITGFYPIGKEILKD